MTVYSNETNRGHLPKTKCPPSIPRDTRVAMDGLEFLAQLPDASVSATFFDPAIPRSPRQTRLRQRRRPPRPETLGAPPDDIRNHRRIHPSAIDRVLGPSGHLFLWIDKFHLCSGINEWTEGTSLETVDLVTWNKGRIGMGYRTRRTAEYLIVLQKVPKRAKGVWTRHDIPDVWTEKPSSKVTHSKPVGLQQALIESTTAPNDPVLDPAAGSFSVLEACQLAGRTFVGCDVNG